MTTTYEIYANEDGTPVAVEGKAPAIVERVETLEETLANEVVTSVNDETGAVYVKKLIMGAHVLELQEDGTLKLDENLVITSAGGTVDGTITFSIADAFKRSSNDSGLVFFGGTTDTSGSVLQLYGDSFAGNPGGFSLSARKDGVDYTFWGQPDGALVWGGKQVERVNSYGEHYIRYENGLQICWGNTENTWTYIANFPLPFKDDPAVFATVVSNSPDGRIATVDEVSTTGFTIYKSAQNGGYWMAIGRWKQ